MAALQRPGSLEAGRPPGAAGSPPSGHSETPSSPAQAPHSGAQEGQVFSILFRPALGETAASGTPHSGALASPGDQHDSSSCTRAASHDQPAAQEEGGGEPLAYFGVLQAGAGQQGAGAALEHAAARAASQGSTLDQRGACAASDAQGCATAEAASRSPSPLPSWNLVRPAPCGQGIPV
jgi:hypothetical protein